jgi:hypothetical protein
MNWRVLPRIMCKGGSTSEGCSLTLSYLGSIFTTRPSICQSRRWIFICQASYSGNIVYERDTFPLNLISFHWHLS